MGKVGAIVTAESGLDRVRAGAADEALAPGPAAWLLLLRRSSGIPDAVSDENARAVLAGRLAAKFDKQGDEGTPQQLTREAADRIIGAILDLGAEGKLDDCLVQPGGMANDVLKKQRLAEGAGGRVAERARYEAKAKEGWDEIDALLCRAGEYARKDLEQRLK